MRMIRKLLNRIHTHLHIFFKQKRFNDVLYYLPFIKKNEAKTLVVVFSGFANKARYNYIRTLKKYSISKIFILDNFGYKKLGSYYMGIIASRGVSPFPKLLLI